MPYLTKDHLTVWTDHLLGTTRVEGLVSHEACSTPANVVT
jgi:hypothetical protein